MSRRLGLAYGGPTTGLPRARDLARRARNPIAENAARHARTAGVSDEAGRPFWRPFLWWLVSRLLGFAVLLGGAWAVYDVASSDHLLVRTIRVEGNALVEREALESTAAVLGANLFWVNLKDVETRLTQFSAVQRVEVEAVLPDTIALRVVERQPAARWRSGGQTHLVDRDGRVLLSVAAGAEDCDGLGCTLAHSSSLPLVEQVDGGPLVPGERVDASVLAASERLARLLPERGVQPLAFEWSASTGLEIPTQHGWRVRFDGERNVEQQLTTLATMHDHLVRSGQSASVIDVRFGDRPYFR